MSTKICGHKGSEEDRLPMFHRTIRLPAALWKDVKARSAEKRKAIRWVVDDALDAELMPLIASLRRFGFKGEQQRTLEEVGREFGLTRDRIRQIESKTLAKMKAYRSAQCLREFLD